MTITMHHRKNRYFQQAVMNELGLSDQQNKIITTSHLFDEVEDIARGHLLFGICEEFYKSSFSSCQQDGKKFLELFLERTVQFLSSVEIEATVVQMKKQKLQQDSI